LLILFVDGVIVLQLIGSALDREISMAAALFFALCLLIVNGIMFQHADDPVGPALALILVAFAVSHRLLRNVANQRALLAIQLQDLREHERTIAERPELPYPYRAIGDFFYQRGMWEEAIPYYQRYLEINDDPEVKGLLRNAEDELRRQRKGLKLCPRCLSEIPREATECPVCHHFLGLVDFRELLGRWWRVEMALLAGLTGGLLVWAALKLGATNPVFLLALLPPLALLAYYGRWYVQSLRWRKHRPVPPASTKS